jgi:hypothetical protein
MYKKLKTHVRNAAVENETSTHANFINLHESVAILGEAASKIEK